MKIKWKILILSMLICFLPAIIGSLFMTESLNSWYDTLNKPWFTPPGWAFGPVWTTLYFLMGISLYLIATKTNKNEKNILYLVFGTQLIFNGFWTIVFFTWQSIFYAFLVILALDICVILTIDLTYRYSSKKTAYLLIPYMIWLVIATLLNLFILILNPGV